MNHHHDGGGSAVSINPETLGTLISDATTAADDVEAFTSAYRPRFSTYAVSTSNLTQMETVAQWVRDQIPMLERRRELAQVAADQYGVSFVTAGAGELAYETSDEAAAQGEEDAQRLLDGVDTGDEVPAEVYELLTEHSGDPDYLEAFFNALEPQFLDTFWVDVHRDQPLGEYDRAKMVPLSYALATASRRIDFTDPEWLHQAARNRTNEWELLVGFMDYGVWDGAVLSATADHLGFLDPDSQATVFEALARNPVAAATWYQGTPPEESYFDSNAEIVGLIMQGEIPMFANDQTEAAVIGFLDAATSDAARWDQELADTSVFTLLEDVNGWNGSAEQPFQEWLGTLVERHIDDVYDSVTSPAASYFTELRADRRGVEAPAEWWASVTEQALRDEATGAYLSAVFDDRYQEELDRWVATEPEGHPQDGNNLALAQNRFFSDWFVTRVESTAEALDLEYDEMIERYHTGIDILFNVDNPKGFLKDIGKRGLKSIVSGFFENRRPDYSVPMSWTELEEGLYGYASRFVDNRMSPEGTFPTVVIDRGDYQLEFDGNPTEYEQRHGGTFTVDHGEGAEPRYSLLPIDEIRADPNALRAYLEWVQDPAVVNAYWNDFASDLPGSLSTPD